MSQPLAKAGHSEARELQVVTGEAQHPVILCGSYVIRISDDVERFADVWPTLAELEVSGAKGFAFQCRDHLSIWQETIGAATGTRPLFVAVFERNGAPVMLLPLGIVASRGLKVLGFLDGGVADYNAPLLYGAANGLAADDVLAIWHAICRSAGRFDLAMLEKMPDHVEGIPNPLKALFTRAFFMSGHMLTLAGDGADAIAPKRRRDLKESRRKRKRIAEVAGEVSYAIATEKQEIHDVFDVFVRQKSRRYQETLGHEGFDVPGQRAYYLTLTERLAGKGAQLAYLRAGNEIIATSWSLISARRLFYLMAGFEDGVWRRHSPGRLLLEDLLTWCLKNDIAVFDFGIGDEAYKHKWHESAIPLWLGLHPHSVRGFIAFAASELRHRMKTHLPPAVLKMAASLRKRPAAPKSTEELGSDDTSGE